LGTYGVFAQDDSTSSKEELAKINRELDNPLAKRWSLVFKENYTISQGDLLDGDITSNTFFFQPALPVPFGKNKVFTARPIFPKVGSVIALKSPAPTIVFLMKSRRLLVLFSLSFFIARSIS